MELAHPLQQLHLFWESFTQGLGVCLLGFFFFTIILEAHL